MQIGDKVIIKVNDVFVGELGTIRKIEKSVNTKYLISLDSYNDGFLYVFHEDEFEIISN